MRTKLKAVTCIVLVLIMCTSAVANASEENHWVFGELKDYKQLIVPNRDHSLQGNGPISPEEWQSFQAEVLDAQKLDQPITPNHWATALKLSLRLPRDEQLITMYVQNLAGPGATDISREKAVGGMVKLLTLETIRGEWRSAGARDATKQLDDYKDIDNIQSALVGIAYRDRVLDSTVSSKFRPKDKLTHAEAISMLDHVMKTYRYVNLKSPSWPKSHWSTSEMISFLVGYSSSDNVELTGLLQSDISRTAGNLDEPIPAGLWHMLLLSAARLPIDNKASDYDAQLEAYTLGMADGLYIDRGHALIGLTKIGGPKRDANREELAAASKVFSDFEDAADKSKLALALGEGLIGGYEDGTFKPHNDLTHGEACVLAVRLSQSGPKPQLGSR